MNTLTPTKNLTRLALSLPLMALFAANSMAAPDAAPSGAPSVEPYILTPPAPATPRINGASVFGVRPGSPFLLAA